MNPVLRVAPCSYQAAEYAVMNWHYSKRMPKGALATLGVWEDDSFIGAILFGRGATPTLAKSFNVSQVQFAELVRVALRSHTSTVTRIVAISIATMRKASKGLRILESFADPRMGHDGTIYKAGNWTYLGTTDPKKLYLLDGVWTHQRTMTHGKASTYNKLPFKIQPPKHRYAYPLDAAMTEQVKRISLPYPPKLSGEKGSPRGATTGEGGSIPTSPHLFDLGVPRFPELPWSALRRLDVLAPGEVEPMDDAQIGFTF